MDKKQEKSTKENKFKRLIFTWWIWVIIALVFYIIFVLVPFESYAKTLFAYITQIAWIIVVCLLIFEFIKWIQKRKIADYWKIAITILGIIGIIAYVIYSLSGWAIFNNLFQGYDERIGDSENRELTKIHIEMLEEEGYEVLYFGYLNLSTEYAYVKMKSLGTRQYQVEDGLFSLSQIYPNAPEYTIRILEPTQECWYIINGTIYRAYRRALEETNFTEALENIEEYKESAVFILGQYVDYQIENPICS
jgi:amino acid transporter